MTDDTNPISLNGGLMQRTRLASYEANVPEQTLYNVANSDPLANEKAYFNTTSQFPEIIQPPSAKWLREQLRHRCSPNDSSLWNAEPAVKIAAISKFMEGFLPMEEHCRLATSIIAAVVENARSHSVENPRFRRYFYQLPKVLRGRKALSARGSVDDASATTFVLKGRPRTGRTLFLKRLSKVLGPAFRVVPEDVAAPPQVWYFPMVMLPWCSSVEALLASFREKIASEVRDPLADELNVLYEMRGEAATDAAVAACILFNVGLFVLDGANAEHIGGEYEAIFGLVEKLNRFGIPVVLSCSEAFFLRASMGGAAIEKALGTQITTFGVLPDPASFVPSVEPKNSKLQGKNDDCSLWEQFCRWYWRAGMFCELTYPMPAALIHWTYEICLGRIGWLAAGFRALHEELINKPELLEHLTQELVQNVFKNALAASSDSRRVIRTLGEKGGISESEFLRHMDHLPLSAAESLNMTKFLPATRNSRAHK